VAVAVNKGRARKGIAERPIIKVVRRVFVMIGSILNLDLSVRYWLEIEGGQVAG
jgi:hypothetical protein